VWELIFMMVVLKIPILYLCWIVYWAIKSEPRPEENARVLAEASPDGGPGWTWRRRAPRRLPQRPHGGPARGYRAPARAALLRAERRR
jgi:hypothetical protein